jgi:hypothetical protein
MLENQAAGNLDGASSDSSNEGGPAPHIVAYEKKRWMKLTF